MVDVSFKTESETKQEKEGKEATDAKASCEHLYACMCVFEVYSRALFDVCEEHVFVVWGILYHYEL